MTDSKAWDFITTRSRCPDCERTQLQAKLARDDFRVEIQKLHSKIYALETAIAKSPGVALLQQIHDLIRDSRNNICFED